MYAAKRKNAPVQSVDRAVLVMELLYRQGVAGVTDVADALGIHKSSAYRLLVTLSERGLVTKVVGTEKYRLGFGLVVLASAVSGEMDLVSHARPVCDRLSERTRETVTISILEGEEEVIIHQSISVPSVLGVDWWGQRTPSHATANGKVLLAHLSEEQQRSVLEEAPLDRCTENTVVDAEALERQLEEIRARGYGYILGELEVGLNAVAAPVRQADGTVVAAMSVSGPAFRMEEDSIPEFGALVREAAMELSQSLAALRDADRPGNEPR